jgi:hypothetical protein
MSVRELEKIAAEIRDNLEISASRTKVDHAKRSIANHIQSTERGYATRLTVIIYRCYRQRQHSHDVAEDLGMTPGAVRQALHRANLIARRLFPELCSEDHWSVKPEDERKRNKRIQRYKNGVAADDPWPELLFIAALYNSGVTLRELGENFGKSHCSIHVWLKRYGLIEPSRKNSSQFCEGPYTRQRNGDVQPSLV